MKTIILTSFLLTSLFLCNQFSNAQCHLEDWTTLKALYESTDGDKWNNNFGWKIMKADEPPIDCDLKVLYGITVDGDCFVDDEGVVTCNDNLGVFEIDLAYNNLSGTIPPEIGNLNYLKSLNLSGNNITGNIPPEIGDFPDLTELILFDNNLTGTIPSELGDLLSLKNLSLDNNRLQGAIPSELGNLNNLEALFLYSNLLIGPIPAQLGNLYNLKDLYLSSNKINGAIPSELGNLNNLENLSLFNNQLSGSIPMELGNLTNLKYFGLGNNQISGSIPAELGNLSNLLDLSFDSNMLTGPIPSELGKLNNLEGLGLSGNYLNGTIPPEIGNLSNLKNVHFGVNDLTGTIPPELGNLSNLESMYFSYNQFTGDIPIELSELNNISVLSFTGNQLSGALPVELANIDNLTILQTTYNNLKGCYAQELTQLCSQLRIDRNKNTEISDGNNFDATWEDFCLTNAGVCVQATCNLDDWTALKIFFETTNGDNWINNEGWEIVKAIEPPTDCDLSSLYGIYLNNQGRVSCIDMDGYLDCNWGAGNGNNLSGSIPAEIGDFKHLEHLSLSSNHLSGNIPLLLASLSNLKYLNLSHNELEGSIPAEFGNLSKLVFLYLSGNQLTGDIPASLANLSRLSHLWLGGNRLSGAIPTLLGFLSNLEVLWLDGNRLTGSIPNEFGNLTNLTSLGLSYNGLSGNIPVELGSLYKLKNLSLSNNQLTGSIPPSLGEMNNLERLYLSYNQLMGPIPEELENNSFLTEVHLNGNELSGNIPSSLGNLSKLIVLSLGSNQLTGRIPSSFGLLNNLEGLYLGGNLLSGEIPLELAEMNDLDYLYVNNNSLSGCYANNLKKLCNQLKVDDGNVSISNGNNFAVTWNEFCYSDLGACNEVTVEVPTNYSGNVKVTVTETQNGEPKLKNNYAKVMDFEDCDLGDIGSCKPITGFSNLAANEVLWATEKAAQYFKDTSEITLPSVSSLVDGNYKGNPNSSIFKRDIKTIIYGAGDSINRKTMTAPDIVGHEFMHYIISSTKNLSAYGESGALNESFADIFGEVLEHYCYEHNDWIYGSQVTVINEGIRSLSNPKDTSMHYQVPNTYKGEFWVDQEQVCFHIDYCGIHSNSGVHNHWFYLLSNGGSGINDNGYSYDIEGIGIEKAAQIAFTNLFTYLTPNSTYVDAMYGSINAAIKLFEENSKEVEQTIKAWEAVGLSAFNPITWKIINFETGEATGDTIPVSFDLAIDSLGLDLSADNLNFTLHLEQEYMNMEIENIYAPLAPEDLIIIEGENEISVSISLQDLAANKKTNAKKRISSGSAIVNVIGCIVVIDIGGECSETPSIDISGGTLVSEDNIINFKSSTLLFGDNCINTEANELNVALVLNNKNCLSLGALEVEILNEEGFKNGPYNYYLYDNNGALIDNFVSTNEQKHQFYNLDAGAYQLYVEDDFDRNFIKDFDINFIAEINGSDCCPLDIKIPNGEITGKFAALNSISFNNGTTIINGDFEICE